MAAYAITCQWLSGPIIKDKGSIIIIKRHGDSGEGRERRGAGCSQLSAVFPSFCAGIQQNTAHPSPKLLKNITLKLDLKECP